MKRYLFRNFIPVYFSLIQLGYFIAYVTRNGVNAFTPDVSGVMIFLLSFFSLNLFIYILDRATSRLASGRLAIVSAVLFLYNILYAYHYRQKNSFDYSILADNASDAFTVASFGVIVNRLNGKNIFIAVLLVLLFIMLYRKITRMYTVALNVRSFVVATALYVLILIVPFPTYDEATFYFKSIIDYYRSSLLYRTDSTEQYPLIRPFDPIVPETGKKKNVFLIIVESFNGNFIERRDAHGREYTPYFNSLLKKGIYVENYYSNSIQTARSQFAIYCSVIPSFRRKEFTDYSDVNYYSIAQALKDNAYRTIFFQAYKKLDFDNTGVFLKKNGFSDEETSEKYRKLGDESHYTNWGVSDEIFFTRFIDYLHDVQKTSRTGQPLFISLLTVGNHMYFDGVRPGDRKFYASPSRLNEYYCNSVYITDQALKIFFDRMKKDPLYDDSVFIITGDHPFPLGEHGLESNEASFYEEFHKVPLLIVGKGIDPARISGCAYSHLDLAPTIADLAGIRVKRTHWAGVSILRPEKRKHFLFLVQPYSGRFLTVIDYPYKYTRHLRTSGEYLFNLREDPGERHNLMWDGRLSSEKETLRGALKTFFLNQRLLEENRIWDKS